MIFQKTYLVSLSGEFSLCIKLHIFIFITVKNIISNVFKVAIIYKQNLRQYRLIFLRKFVDNFLNRFQNKLYKEI